MRLRQPAYVRISAYMRNMRKCGLMRIGKKWRMANPTLDDAHDDDSDGDDHDEQCFSA